MPACAKEGFSTKLRDFTLCQMSLMFVYIFTVRTMHPLQLRTWSPVYMGRYRDGNHYISCPIVSRPTALDTPSTNQHVSTVCWMMPASDPTITAAIPVATPGDARHDNRGTCAQSEQFAAKVERTEPARACCDRISIALVYSGDYSILHPKRPKRPCPRPPVPCSCALGVLLPCERIVQQPEDPG